jgi:hypothetical protein
MFETNPDFVFTVTRDFVRSCQNPVLALCRRHGMRLFPWKEPKERIPLAVSPDSFFPQGASARLAACV